MRPLGLPVFTDKLIQEAIRMILEAIYEPIFQTTLTVSDQQEVVILLLLK